MRQMSFSVDLIRRNAARARRSHWFFRTLVIMPTLGCNQLQDRLGVVGYKPPPPAFQIGKAVVGKVSARQICRDVPNEAESAKSMLQNDKLHSQYKVKSYKMIEYKAIGLIQSYRMNIKLLLVLSGM